MISNVASTGVFWGAIEFAQLGILLWVLVRHRGMMPVLLVNLVTAIVVLQFVLPYLPAEIRDIRAGNAVELFDYKNVILTVFEGLTLIASGLAWRGVVWGKIIAWLGFAGNFTLSVAAAVFFMTFKFKCCGYL